MRYLLGARVRSDKRAELLEALDAGRFGEGFPYGDLGDVLRAGRVDPSGTIRWVEVCYCREAYGVAMQEELPYFERYLTDLTITDARNPRRCEGYPVCSTCDCTRNVRPRGEPLVDYLRRTVAKTEPEPRLAGAAAEPRPTRWLGWRGQTTAEEALRNQRHNPASPHDPNGSDMHRT